MLTARYDTPLGALELGYEGDLLLSLRIEPAAAKGDGGARCALTDEACAQVLAYLRGERRAFDLPCAARGTDFQRAVWRALEQIPYGETRAYGEIARTLGRPGAARAVGAACGRNPLWLIVPCHRAIGADGSLTGYAGGTDLKRRLLGLERGERSGTDR